MTDQEYLKHFEASLRWDYNTLPTRIPDRIKEKMEQCLEADRIVRGLEAGRLGSQSVTQLASGLTCPYCPPPPGCSPQNWGMSPEGLQQMERNHNANHVPRR